MSAVYRVTVTLSPECMGTVVVRADDRAQAKARALTQIRSMGYDVAEGDVKLCRKDKPATGVIGNRPAPSNGGKPA